MWNIARGGSYGQKARMFAPFLLLAGFGQFPFAGAVGSLLGLLLSPFFDDGFEPEADIPRLLAEWAGKDPAKRALAGFCGGLSRKAKALAICRRS
ncbi:MAG: hypothetical protein LBO03_04155 [Acidaminococcales bacterium]|nr:hypothetical protein [Acidaminococcales bacterium]